MKIEKINYKGWENCFRLSNNKVELIVTTDIGPRIIKFGFIDEKNEFREVPEHAGLIGGNEWRSYGGHRLWHSPEDKPRTYQPDNQPVNFIELGDGSFRVSQPTELLTGIQKEIDIKISETDSSVEVKHRLINKNQWEVELAVWALSVMLPGGIAIIPLPERRSHLEDLLPSNQLVLWSYTDMSDKRWTWGTKYILLKQKQDSGCPQKIGIADKNNWAAYCNQEHLFVKLFEYNHDKTYPDFGCSAEVFTNDFMLELETLGTLTKIKPGSSVEHVEKWFLYKNISLPQNDDDVDKFILPLVNSILYKK